MGLKRWGELLHLVTGIKATVQMKRTVGGMTHTEKSTNRIYAEAALNRPLCMLVNKTLCGLYTAHTHIRTHTTSV